MVEIGQKIHIIKLLGAPEYSGKNGTIKRVDESGLLYGTWGPLAIDLEKDTVEFIGLKNH